ncbi:hypothetical protein MPH_04873 [Macrophomina phaseolina MS6]|uniref:Uncharacterized protein n=1 Tax=Macrophomina phaseolina (strain MS6) TaxID=1126212 RepID=K2S5U7_MACPH|nr:hypothetical protein MPH_04873 [Macrophomina phaseolina MS6]
MAYRDYDDRPRYSSRRYEPNTSRSRDYEHVKGQQYPYDRRRPEYYDLDQRRTPSAADYDARYAEDLPPAYAYDPRDRDRYPPTPPPTASYRVERHRRASWPPLPTVEDIEVALAKEAANHAWEDGKRGDEAPNRGSVDQEPILVEVEEEMARFNQERRFVIVPGSGDGAEQPADDVRIRRSMRQPVDRQKAPPLQTDLRDPPVNTTRSRSPYSYSRTSAAPKERSSGDSYLSPESAASSTSFGRTSGVRADVSGRTDPVKSRPAPLQTQSLFPTDSRRDNVISDGSDLSADESHKLRERRKPARYSFSPADLKKDDLRTSLHDLTSPPERVSSPYSYAPTDSKKDDLRTPLAASVMTRERVSSPYTYTPSETKKDSIKHTALDPEPIKERVSSPYSYSPAEVKEDIRLVPRERDLKRDRLSGQPNTPPTSTSRSTPKGSGSSSGDTPSSSQFLPGDLPWGRPKPSRQGTAETLYGSAEDNRQSSKSSKTSTRPASPRSRENSLPPSPPRSPRLRPHEGDARVRRDPGSRPASLYSRAPSPLADEQNHRPSSPRIEASGGRPDRTSTFPLSGSPKDQSTPVSRQSRYEVATTDDLDPYLQEPPPRIGIQSPSPTRHPTSKSTTSLPYPVDDIMPAEQSYQFIPESPRSPRRTTSDYHRGPVVVPIPTHVREEVDSGRSPLRRTLSEGSVQKERKEPRSVPSTAQGNEIQQEVVPDMPDLPLPPCPRSTYSSRYRDWYTLDSVPSFDICPDCLDNIIGHSMFRRYFERAHPTDLPKKCHFSSPWYRLAWLMTLKEKRRNLDLIFSLASITDTEAPCPGETKDVRTWYGLRNNRGNDFIPNLYICERDVLYLEALMPTLGGCFQPMDSSARICSFRSTSTRFPQYLDTLLEVHEQALKSRTGAPDMAPFLNLASAHAWKRECTRDEILLGNPWHFLPGIPEFTVCEECYEDVVYPEVKRGSRLADDVTRTLQFVPSDAEFTGEGNSCQLYSLRMRRVWARAVEDDDAVYLARKVRERRKIHRDLKNQERSLRRLLDETLRERELGYSYGSGSVSSGLAPERLKEELDAVRMEWKNWE